VSTPLRLTPSHTRHPPPADTPAEVLALRPDMCRCSDSHPFMKQARRSLFSHLLSRALSRGATLRSRRASCRPADGYVQRNGAGARRLRIAGAARSGRNRRRNRGNRANAASGRTAMTVMSVTGAVKAEDLRPHSGARAYRHHHAGGGPGLPRLRPTGARSGRWPLTGCKN